MKWVGLVLNYYFIKCSNLEKKYYITAKYSNLALEHKNLINVTVTELIRTNSRKAKLNQRVPNTYIRLINNAYLYKQWSMKT